VCPDSEIFAFLLVHGMDGYWLRVYRCVYDQGSGEDHYVEKTLGHVSAWLQDTQGADAWSKGL